MHRLPRCNGAARWVFWVESDRGTGPPLLQKSRRQCAVHCSGAKSAFLPKPHRAACFVASTMLTNAMRLCEAKFGVLYLYDEGRLRFGAAHDVPPAFAEARGKRFRLPTSQQRNLMPTAIQ
jgi:hypothetical protein